MNAKHPNCFGNVHSFEWTDAFYKKDFDAFLNIFHPEVTQSASTSPFIFYGSQEVAETFKWASDFYKRCDFVHQASASSIEFLEFDLTTLNDMHMTGMTVLTKNQEGKVIKVFNGHRNLMETVIFTEHFVKGQKHKGIVSLFHKIALKTYGLNLKFPRNSNNIQATKDVIEKEYVDAFQTGTAEAFEYVCDDNVILSGNYVTKEVKGVQNVSMCMEQVASFYEHCLFTTQATCQGRTYILYKGMLRNGLAVTDGFLILVRNGAGKITQILDNPIPMHVGTLISSYIAENCSSKSFVENYLYSEDLFQKSVEKYTLDNVHGKKTRDLSSFKGFIAQFFIKL